MCRECSRRVCFAGPYHEEKRYPHEHVLQGIVSARGTFGVMKLGDGTGVTEIS